MQERRYLKNVTPKTLAWYKDSFHAFKGALDNEASINQRIVELRSRGVSAVSVNTWLRCVNAYLRWRNAGFSVPRLKEQQNVLECYSPEQIHRIVEFRPTTLNMRRVHVLTCLLLDTGLRLTEALSLVCERVDFDNLLLRVLGKGQRERLVPFSCAMRKLLWRWLNNRKAGFVFQTSSSTPLGVRNAQRDFATMCKRLNIVGVRRKVHALRHTFALTYIRKGGDPFRLQRVLGHSSLEMTRRYVRLQTQDLQSVHEHLSALAG